MFDPIKGPANQYQGPAIGDSTENGDNWHTAIIKINAGFKHIISAIEQGVGHVIETIDVDARKEIDELREQISAMQIKWDAFHVPQQSGAVLGPAPIGGVAAAPTEPAPLNHDLAAVLAQ